MKKNDTQVVVSESAEEQKRISRLLIQKDLQLTEVNDQLNRQVSQLKVLQRIASETRPCLTDREVLEKIGQGFVFELHFSAAFFFLGTPPFTVPVKYHYEDVDIEALRRHPILEAVYRKGTPRRVLNLINVPNDEKTFSELIHLTSFYIAPIQIREKSYGVYVVGLNDPYQRLSETDIEFFDIAAHAIGATLESIALEAHQNRIEALKSEFISIVSHQLRTPLSIVKWILKMMIDGDFGKDNAREQEEFLKRAYESNERMIRLVNDLLNVSRIEEGRLEYHPLVCNLREILNEVAGQYNIVAVKKKIAFSFTVKGDEPVLQVIGDREQLLIVFNNLIDNAFKFTSSRGNVDVIGERVENGDIKVTIRDTGIGVDPSDQKKMFTKFFRAENAKRMQTEGTGLGLFIVKNIIETHHGSIAVESYPGKGTSVAVILPESR